MAAMDSFFRERDGKLYMQVTPGRAQALLEALDVALSSDRLANEANTKVIFWDRPFVLRRRRLR
jgi:hypothetical protein